MQNDYYQNIVYPFQDKVLEVIDKLDIDFYLTGDTVLSRIYLNHRFSDDLDFFVNQSNTYKTQVELIINSLRKVNFNIDISVADSNFSRIFVKDKNVQLKIDFVNDVPFRKGKSIASQIFKNTDNIFNIMSNKVSALSRFLPKDVIDILYISLKYNFSREEIFYDASLKDMWVNPIEASKILDSFPINRIDEICWLNEIPDKNWFKDKLDILINDIILKNNNTLFSQ